MSKAKTVLTPTVVPSDGVKQVCGQMEFWKALTQEEQKAVLMETQGLYNDLAGVRRLRLSAARHVARVHAVLEGRGFFVKYLHSLDQSVRSSYRWFNRLNDANLPSAVLDAAELRGMDLIQTSYLETVKALPLPKNLDSGAVEKYLDKVARERARMARERPEAYSDPTEAEREAWRAVVRRYKALPPRRRGEWASRLLSRLMAAMGLPAQRLEPEAWPEDFQPRPGRPASGQ